MSVKIMIVDDEPYCLKDMHNMLMNVNSIIEEEIEIICEARRIDEAKKKLLENDLDLVFLDIQLRGGTGFDLIPFIDESVKIIFVTAYDQYAIKAFEVNALDYILKPVTPAVLTKSLMRLFSNFQVDRKIDNKSRLERNDRVLIKTDTNRMFIKIDEIVVIFSIGGNYANVALKNGEKYLCRKTIKAWGDLLPESMFIRIHRATIINIHFTKQVCYERDGSVAVHQEGCGGTFSVSRRMRGKFRDLIKNMD